MNIKDKKLVIVLDEINGVPSVFINGEEIKCKQSIKFDWKTADNNHVGVANFEVNYTKLNQELIDLMSAVDTRDHVKTLLDSEDAIIKLTDEFGYAGINRGEIEHVRYEEFTKVEGCTTSHVKSRTLPDLYYGKKGE